ncbi:unnamed protein product, partial [Laminaria digitata]
AFAAAPCHGPGKAVAPRAHVLGKDRSGTTQAVPRPNSGYYRNPGPVYRWWLGRRQQCQGRSGGRVYR